MTEIYVIRHVQAEGNLYRHMQGHWDGDVTPVGVRQRDALAERFRDVPVDAVYSSDLWRARFTASAITKYHDLPVQLDARLREINIGPCARSEGRQYFCELFFHGFPPRLLFQIFKCPCRSAFFREICAFPKTVRNTHSLYIGQYIKASRLLLYIKQRKKLIKQAIVHICAASGRELRDRFIFYC